MAYRLEIIDVNREFVVLMEGCVMSMEILSRELFRFLKEDKPKVIAIRGAWGVGKTHAWSSILSDFASGKDVDGFNYSYVSLFGVEDLSGLKSGLFENMVSSFSGSEKASVDSLAVNARRLGERIARKSFKHIRKIPHISNFSLFFESMSYLSINNALVCIDDLERRGSRLRINDLIGLVSQLKEQKGCKVVLIFNEDAISDEDKSELAIHREKVVDIDMLFSPTVDESVAIAVPHESDLYDMIKEKFEDLGCSNIRVIRKAFDLCERLKYSLEGYEEEVFSQAINTAILYTCCYYGSNANNFPNYEYVKNIGIRMMMPGEDDGEEGEQKKAWNYILSRYGYHYSDELDLEIAKYVENGYFEDEAFKRVADVSNESALSNRSERSFSAAWRAYHYSFDNNEEEVVGRIRDSFYENIVNISPLNLDGTVRLFRELGQGDLANEIIDAYVKAHEHDSGFFDLSAYPFGSDIKDSRVVEVFERKKSEEGDERGIDEIIDSILKRGGFSYKDVEALSVFSENDFFAFFKGCPEEYIDPSVRYCVGLASKEHRDEKEERISVAVTGALRKIAGESRINRRRVAKYGINVDD